MARLVALDAAGAGFVDGLQRAWDAGDAVLPVDPRLPTEARAALRQALRAGEEVEPGDALVVATSGSTGTPKGVVLTHDAVRASAQATSSRLGVDPATHHWLACLPLAHVGGLSVVTRALLTGTPVEVHDRFDPTRVDDAATSTTLVSLVGTALGRLRRPERFHTIVLGGSAPPSVRPTNTVVTYGMTESGSGVVYDGHPLEGVGVRTDTGGQIWLRGPMLLRAYRDGTDPRDAGGWYPTGDLGHWDATATRLEVFGRQDDLIITGGENVFPEPVEAVLATAAGVAEVAVVARPDAEWGEIVVAVVVPVDPSQPPSLEDLRAAVRDRLGAWAAPRALVLRPSLPRTALGKLQRSRLRREVS